LFSQVEMFDTARTVQVISFVPCGRPPSKGGEFSRRLLAMSGREERRGRRGDVHGRRGARGGGRACERRGAQGRDHQLCIRETAFPSSRPFACTPEVQAIGHYDRTKFIALTHRLRNHLDQSASVSHAVEAELRRHRSRGAFRNFNPASGRRATFCARLPSLLREGQFDR
jgi:hypothetical protein